jgi:predicted aminopeptidase
MRRALPLLAMGLLFISGCASQVGYLAKQGISLLRYSTGARPVDAVIADPATPADTRAFLKKVRDIKSFAVQKLGLKNNENYTKYKQIDRDHLVDVVQACDAASFDAYTWDYPFLGRLPYRGYYERPDADAEAARLRKLGYDVIVRPVDAFSTLGFTKDPVYSFLEGYSPFEIASVIIHEQTHATLFLKGQSEFNEEMASFVGDEGAFEWLKDTYGEESPEYRDALDSQADADLFVSLLHGLSKNLKVVYDMPIPREEKLARKAGVIDEFTRGLADGGGPRFHTDRYAHVEKLKLNNAYLSLYSLYSDDVPLLRDWFVQRCGSSLRTFMASMKELAGHGDVKAQVRASLGR